MVGLTNANSVTTQLREAFGALTANLILEVPALTLTRALVGAVMEVRLNYPDFKANLNGICVSYAAGTITLNTADVPAPTDHHIIIPETTGVITVITTDPDVTYGRNTYVYLSLVRFQSIAGTELVFYLRRMYNPIADLLNEIGHYSSDIPYTWVSGAGMTIDPADGTIDLEATDYRRWKFAGTLGAQTDAALLLDDEATVAANLEAITTYSDGSPITAGRYHKIALLLICSGAADVRIVVLRQDVPTAEYTTLEEARIDAEDRAASVAPTAYYAPTFPLAYVYMLRGDASDLGVIDLRAPGFGGGGGGGAAVGDHSLLVNLAADDHLQYLRTDGTRAMSGDLDMGAQAVTNVGNVDGVDISAHAADVTAHGRAYGSIYVTGGAAGQALTDGAAAKLTAYTANGLSLNTTPDHTNDQITVTNAGNYRITGAFTFESATANRDLSFFAAVGGAASVIGARQECIDDDEYFSASFNGFLTLGAGAIVTVLATVGGGNATLTMRESHLTVERL